eukprot:3040086-Amphidinium_carterae.1
MHAHFPDSLRAGCGATWAASRPVAPFKQLMRLAEQKMDHLKLVHPQLCYDDACNCRGSHGTDASYFNSLNLDRNALVFC